MFLNSLSGRFLILTTVFVMLAEVLIFVPSVARFREDYLLVRLEKAQIASLALLADDMLTMELEEELLKNAGVFNVVLRRDQSRQLVLSSPIPSPIENTFDLRQPSAYELIGDAMRRLSARYPEDLEAAAFYALSILGTVPERDFRTYMRAAAVVEEVFDVAEENLNDRIVLVTAKSVARTFAKRELTKQLEDDHGILGRLVGDVFASATERADLRFWQTLPDTYQAARMFVDPGEHGLELQAGPAGTARLGRFQLEPGETLVILARTVDYQLFANVIGGTPVAPALTPISPAPNATNDPVESMPILGD